MTTHTPRPNALVALPVIAMAVSFSVSCGSSDSAPSASAQAAAPAAAQKPAAAAAPVVPPVDACTLLSKATSKAWLARLFSLDARRRRTRS